MTGILAPVMVIVVASFIDNALAFASTDGQIVPLIITISLMTLYYAFTQVSQIVARIVDKALENGLRENLRPQLIQKQANTAYTFLEDAEMMDLIILVCGRAEGQMMAILNTGSMTVRLAIQVFGTLFLLATHIWWMLPFFILSIVPIALIAHRGGRAIYASDKVTTKLTRRHYYISSILVGRETAAERTLFGYADKINREFSAAHLKRSNMVTKEIAIEEIAVNVCGLILNALVLVAIIALLHPVGNGSMSHGLYVSLIGALIGFARMVTGSVSRLISDVTGHFAYMRDFTRFLALPEVENSENQEKIQHIVSFTRLEIHNLRFRYTPESDYVLNGINLVIEQGKSYFLIGQNGAGKSTLTKILLGLYRNFDGEIFINGIDIAKYSTHELHCIFSIVYQDFAKYYISLRDNVTLGGDNENLKSSLQLAELEDVVSKLPKEADTPLGKIYNDGVDISGGEWQKIAIARALNANTPFIILDEPTASLSPMMESKLYRRFAEFFTQHLHDRQELFMQ
jgi:ATP-binding cassette subfamily B protein